MKPSAPFVSVVAAVADQADCIEGFIDSCLDLLAKHYRAFELILVDQGSRDDTVARIDAVLGRRAQVRLIRLAGRVGPDVALRAGLDSVIGDYVVLMQAGIDPPEEIPALLEKAQSGQALVTGIDRSGHGESWLHRRLRGLFGFVAARLLGIPYTPGATRLQALNRAAVTAALRSSLAVFPVLPSQVGYPGATHEYRRVGRGPSSFSHLSQAIDRGLSLLVVESVSPLRLVSYLGLLAGGLNVLYALYVVLVNLIRDDVVRGWTTLSLTMSGMFFLLFLILVVVCEYLGRILVQTRDRPVYHVVEERNSRVAEDDWHNVLSRSA